MVLTYRGGKREFLVEGTAKGKRYQTTVAWEAKRGDQV